MWNRRGTDPSLDELFHDVTIQLLMRRDGVGKAMSRLLGELKDARRRRRATRDPAIRCSQTRRPIRDGT